MRMTWPIRTLMILCVALATINHATAAKRIALVIGNAAYQHAPTLANPGNDADDLAKTLGQLGFEVTRKRDLKKSEMDSVLSGFAASLKGAEMGLFFYAGHGLQVAGQNYLVPVDATLDSASALEFEAVRLDLVQRIMENETATNVLILDACRDNPLSRNLARSMGTRSSAIGKGLAAQESGAGTLISYSTQPGNVALDGTGRNSPFASALLKHLPSAGRGLTSALIAVRNEVMAATSKRQVPWEHSALTNELMLAEAGGARAAEVQATGDASEKASTGKAEQDRDTGQKTVAAPQDASPPPPSLIFRDGFDGDELSTRWTVRNEDKSAYVVENGAMLLVTSRSPGDGDLPTVLSAPNALHLQDVALTGDWDFVLKFKPDFGRVSGALVQIGLVDGETIPIRASLDMNECSQGHKVRLVLVTGGQEVATEVELAKSCPPDPALSKKDFGSMIENLAKTGVAMTLHKRGRDYHATVTGPIPGGKARTQRVALLRVKGVPAVAVRHQSKFGQTIVSLDEVAIQSAQ